VPVGLSPPIIRPLSPLFIRGDQILFWYFLLLLNPSTKAIHLMNLCTSASRELAGIQKQAECSLCCSRAKISKSAGVVFFGEISAVSPLHGDTGD